MKCARLIDLLLASGAKDSKCFEQDRRNFFLARHHISPRKSFQKTRLEKMRRKWEVLESLRFVYDIVLLAADLDQAQTAT